MLFFVFFRCSGFSTSRISYPSSFRMLTFSHVKTTVPLETQCRMAFLGPAGLGSSNLAYFLLVVCDVSIRRVGFLNRNFENWAFGRRFSSGSVVVGCFSRFGLFIPEGHSFFVFCCFESTFKSVAQFLPNLRISQNTGEGLGRWGWGLSLSIYIHLYI